MDGGNSFKYIDLFSGIGGIRIPFDELGGRCVFSSEWNEDCQKTYVANFGEKPNGDITKIDPKTIPEHDILLGGFPCQAFSIIGKMQGFKDERGTLFFNIAEILQTKKPFAFLLENVKQLSTHDQGKTFKKIIKTLNRIGYYTHSTVLNALDFGLPQKRERTIIVGFLKNIPFTFPEGNETRANLRSFLEKGANKDESLYASPYIIARRREQIKGKPFYPSVWHENKSGNVSVLPYSVALRSGASHNYILINGERRPSSRELLRFQGFPDSFKIVVPHSIIRKQAGNAVPVPLIRAVAQQVLKSIRNHFTQETFQNTDKGSRPIDLDIHP